MKSIDESTAWMLCIGSFAALLMGAGVAQASVTISTNPTQNMRCSAGVCSPTAKKAVLNVDDLTTMLSSSDVKVVTGAGAITIGIEVPFNWTSAHRLTLDAYYSIHFKAKVTVAGPGAVTLITNDGGAGGDLTFLGGGLGNLTFWDLRSSLLINGDAYTLVGNLKQLSAAIAAKPGDKFALANYASTARHTYTSAPIATTFAGTLEGLGHAIGHLTIDGEKSHDACVGLFAHLSGGGIVRDIRLVEAKITENGSHSETGLLVGCNDDNAVVRNVWAGGSIDASAYSAVGGLVGYNYGLIDNSIAEVLVEPLGGPLLGSYMLVGGLAGENQGAISHSHATGAVSAGQGSAVGGLVGENPGMIVLCYATGAASATHYKWQGDGVHVGGLVGHGGNISQSFATGAVLGGEGYFDNYWAPTLVGGLTGAGNDISQSYAVGPVRADLVSEAGGLLADGDQITQSYSIGLVVADEDGGFAAYPGKNVANDYWDMETSGKTEGTYGGNVTGITGLSDAQLKSGLPSGFDPKIWGQNPSINNGYPYLLANRPPQ